MAYCSHLEYEVIGIDEKPSKFLPKTIEHRVCLRCGLQFDKTIIHLKNNDSKK